MAAGALASLTVAAAPAYATGPHITAVGGPGEALIQGGGFNAGARVRIEALTPDLGKVLETIYVQANWIGYLNADVYLDNLGGYIGNVWVAADGAPGPTAWARTAVSRAPVLWALNSAPVCEGNVYVGRILLSARRLGAAPGRGQCPGSGHVGRNGHRDRAYRGRDG